MTLLAAVLGKRTEVDFKRACSNLRSLGFTFVSDEKEWQKRVDEEFADRIIREARDAGIRVYRKEP